MAFRNMDEAAAAHFEPIQFQLDGEVWTITKVNGDHDIPPEAFNDGQIGLSRVLAGWIGPAVDPARFSNIDLRVLLMTITWIKQTEQAQLKAAIRPSEGEPKPTR